MYITEQRIYGLKTETLLIAIPGRRCVVVETKSIKAESLYLVGLTYHAARLLKSELDVLYL
jgi:hypothetical protein